MPRRCATFFFVLVKCRQQSGRLHPELGGHHLRLRLRGVRFWPLQGFENFFGYFKLAKYQIARLQIFKFKRMLIIFKCARL